MNNINYSKKIINSSLYGVINVENSSLKEELKESGIVFVPFISVEHTEESLKKYDEFKKSYNEQHKYCPKCGSVDHSSTLVGYILNWDNKEDYKDLNRCECMKCGDRHSTHDRVANFNSSNDK